MVLMEPFALPVGTNGHALRAHIAPLQALVRARVLITGATLVPLQDAFDTVAGAHPERWIYDGIHPTAAGQWLIAQRWLETVVGITLPAATPMP